MIYSKRTVSLLFFSLLLTITSCHHSFNRLNVITFNVENLFDDQVDGTEYEDYLDVTSEFYDMRLNQIAGGFDRMMLQYGRPSIVLLQEVENRGVIQNLVGRSRALNGLEIIFAKEDHHAHGLGILTRYPIIEMRSYRVDDPLITGKTLRPILIAVLRLRNDQLLAVMNLHLTSRRFQNNVYRRQSTLARVNLAIDRLRRDYGDDLAIMIGGDFNINLNTREIINQTLFSIDEDISDVGFNGFLNPWPNYTRVARDQGMIHGSYFFRGEWYALDGFLVSHPLLLNDGLTFIRQEPVTLPYFLREIEDSEAGETIVIPRSVNRRRSDGVSDHLPVVALFQYRSHQTEE